MSIKARTTIISKDSLISKGNPRSSISKVVITTISDSDDVLGESRADVNRADVSGRADVGCYDYVGGCCVVPSAAVVQGGRLGRRQEGKGAGGRGTVEGGR